MKAIPDIKQLPILCRTNVWMPINYVDCAARKPLKHLLKTKPRAMLFDYLASVYTRMSAGGDPARVAASAGCPDGWLTPDYPVDLPLLPFRMCIRTQTGAHKHSKNFRLCQQSEQQKSGLRRFFVGMSPYS
jgi:hypothetical protein